MDNANDEKEDDDSECGPDWEGYISVTSWLLQDGVPEEDLFGEENNMLKGQVAVIAKPPDNSRNEWMYAVEVIMGVCVDAVDAERSEAGGLSCGGGVGGDSSSGTSVSASESKFSCPVS